LKESALANAIGLLVMKSSELDYLLRSTLAVFITEDISDNRIYDKAELIVTKFVKISQVKDLLKDLVRKVLCAWYWDDFDRLLKEVEDVFQKRNTHCHNVFHILDEDTYQMSSATSHYNAMTGKGDHKKLHQKHSLKDLQEVTTRTSECISQLEYLMGTPSKGPITHAGFLKLPKEERAKIVERENRSPQSAPAENNEVKKKEAGKTAR
jgi:hypothetical protein